MAKPGCKTLSDVQSSSMQKGERPQRCRQLSQKQTQAVTENSRGEFPEVGRCRRNGPVLLVPLRASASINNPLLRRALPR